MSKQLRSGNGESVWSVRLPLTQIPEAGVHRDIEADAPTRAALCSTAGVRDVVSVRASFDLRHAGRGRVHVTGEVVARVGQICVVSLEPIENNVVEAFDVMFVPENELASAMAAHDAVANSEDDPDPPEAIIGHAIDLGRLAADFLFLGIDPYPRKTDAVFEARETLADAEEHPFAALKALQERK